MSVRMAWKRNIDRLGTRIVIMHISNKHATNLHRTFIHIARFAVRCQVINTYMYEECLSCQEIAPISEKNALPNMMDVGGNYLKTDVLEISMFDFVDRDEPFDDNLNEPIH